MACMVNGAGLAMSTMEPPPVFRERERERKEEHRAGQLEKPFV